MEIEQKPPNKPNFGLIAALSGVVLLVIFAAALFVLHHEGVHLLPATHSHQSL